MYIGHTYRWFWFLRPPYTISFIVNICNIVQVIDPVWAILMQKSFVKVFNKIDGVWATLHTWTQCMHSINQNVQKTCNNKWFNSHGRQSLRQNKHMVRSFNSIVAIHKHFDVFCVTIQKVPCWHYKAPPQKKKSMSQLLGSKTLSTMHFFLLLFFYRKKGYVDAEYLFYRIFRPLFFCPLCDQQCFFLTTEKIN